MTYTQLKVKAEYRDKLKTLADKEHRSMANMLEVLIDQARNGGTTHWPKQPATPVEIEITDTKFEQPPKYEEHQDND